MATTSILLLLVALAAVIKATVIIINEYERGVVYTWGKLEARLRQPGLNFIVPLIQKVQIIDQRIETLDIPSQDVISRDNISIKVNAVLYFRVMDPSRAVNAVKNYFYATNQLAQTTLRSVCGEAELDDLLSKREELNLRIQEILDHQTDPWGIKVTLVEIKHIDLPQEMQRAMAKQAEAERERRAKIIQAEGEFQAADKLKEAADIMSTNPTTLQLRYLETLRTISQENSSTVIFPMPINIFEALTRKNS